MRPFGGCSPCLPNDGRDTTANNGTIHARYHQLHTDHFFGAPEFGWATTSANLMAGLRSALSDHVGLYNHPDGWTQGTVAYLRLPFTRLSMLLEWSDNSFGWGAERSQESWDVYCSQLRASFCRERGNMYTAGWGVR